MENDNGKTDNFFMLDAELLPLIEKAENGCFDSQLELAVAFGDGKGAVINDDLAKEFEQLLFGNTNDVRLRLGLLWNPAIRAFKRGDFIEMEEQFNIAIDFMQENIPMEDWDFELFEIMEKLTQGKD